MSMGLALLPFVATASKIGDLLTRAIGVFDSVLKVLFALAVVVFGWGIVKLIAAAANPEKRKDAKAVLWWGVIGIAVFVSVMGLVRILQVTFGTGTEGVINAPVFDPIGG